MKFSLEKSQVIVELIFKIISILALFVGGIWVLYNFNLTGVSGRNLELSLSTDQIKLNDKSKLLVIHVHTMNHGKVPIEIGGEAGGGFHVTIKEIREAKSGEWVEQESLPVFKVTDILRHHKDGYVIDPNGSYDEVESISLPTGIYHIEAYFDMSDEDDGYANAYSVVKVE